MKSYLFKPILLLVVILSAIPVSAYHFCEANDDGVMIYYNIISEANKTCEVTAMQNRNSWTENDNYTDYVGEVNIPSSANGYTVVRIGDKAFRCCRSLTSVTIPNTVTYIGGYAFRDCSSLTSVIIPDSVVTIGMYAFGYCSSLTSVTIGNSVTTIGGWAFTSCGRLSSIFIPKSVASIDSNPFCYYTNLESIVVEEGNPVYNSANDCNAIIETTTNTLRVGCKNTVIPNTVTTIGDWAFYYCTDLTSIIIPNSVTNIKYSAFDGCSSLTSATIPNSVTTFGWYVFRDCSSLTSVTIPSSVTTIGERVFLNCTSLTSVTSYITDVFETGRNAFYNCPNATLYVPAGLKEAYQSTADWNRLKNIEEIPGISLALACSNQGKVGINNNISFTNKVGEVTVYDGADNTFVFTPDEGCRLDRVLLNGLDVTKSVKNNRLTTVIQGHSSMNVIFTSQGMDVNGDGRVDINDVVTLVNFILGM